MTNGIKVQFGGNTPCRNHAKRVVLVSRPGRRTEAVGLPRRGHARIPTPGEGQVLLRTIWLSLDPYMRGRMSDGPSYATPVPIGGVMEGGTVSRGGRLEQSGLCQGRHRAVARRLADPCALRRQGICAKVDPKLGPVSTAVGVLGMPGMTAYTGLLDIGKPQPGETVVVAAASGAVGSAVGQIAKIKGARAVGIAGGKDKCDYVKRELGFDECLDHRDPDLAAKLKEACPKGIDVYFENVGGAVFEAVFPLLNAFARVPVCGLIAHYNDTEAKAPKWASSMMRNGIDQAPDHPRLHRQRLSPHAMPTSCATCRGGCAKARSSIKRIRHRRDWTAHPRAFMGLSEGRQFRQATGAGRPRQGVSRRYCAT